MFLIKVEVRESAIDGKGVFTLQEIKKGDVIWKFDPTHDKFLLPAEFKALDDVSKEALLPVAYLSRVTNRWVYPPENDPARFTNHSKENNLSAIFKTEISEELIFFANRDIPVDEELTNDYNEFDDLTPKDLKADWR